MDEQFRVLSEWYVSSGRPFFDEHLPGKVGDLDAALTRIQAHDKRVSDELAICFLGDSGIGKSTLINALVAGHELVLPTGGIGPLTALAMEVRYGDEPAFEAEYHNARALWQGAIFGLERGYATQLKEATGKIADESLPPDLLGPDDEGVVTTAVTGGDADAEVPSRLESFQKQAQLLVKGSQDTPSELPYLLDCLREAAGSKRVWGTEVLSEDAERIRRLRSALAMGRDKA